MKRVFMRVTLAIAFAIVLSGAACQTHEPGSATGSVRGIIGTDIIGARGATTADQNRIDLTVEGPCAIGVYRQQECRRHRQISAARRKELD